jgi:cyclohexanone monooxygenase
MRRNGYTSIEATEQSQHDWVAHVGEVASYTLMTKADSWAMGANIPGKPRVYSFYLAGLDAYRNRCTAVAEGGYEGFRLEKAMGAVAA